MKLKKGKTYVVDFNGVSYLTVEKINTKSYKVRIKGDSQDTRLSNFTETPNEIYLREVSYNWRTHNRSYRHYLRSCYELGTKECKEYFTEYLMNQYKPKLEKIDRDILKLEKEIEELKNQALKIVLSRTMSINSLKVKGSE